MKKIGMTVAGLSLLATGVFANGFSSPNYVINIKADGITTTLSMLPERPGPGLGTQIQADSITQSPNHEYTLTGHALVQFKPKGQELSLSADKIVLKGFRSGTHQVGPIVLTGNAVINVKRGGKNAIQFTTDSATLNFQTTK